MTIEKQIRNLLLVIFCGVACAFFVLGILLYNYGPSGRYLAKNTLLSSEVASHLKYNEAGTRLVFDGIEFSYINSNDQRQHLQIDLDHYRKFYDMVHQDKSIANVTEDVIALFDDKTLAHLSLKVRSDIRMASDENRKPFQTVDFVNNGDYYRIDLREEQSLNASPWAYFQHQGIYSKVYHSFVPQP